MHSALTQPTSDPSVQQTSYCLHSEQDDLWQRMHNYLLFYVIHVSTVYYRHGATKSHMFGL